MSEENPILGSVIPRVLLLAAGSSRRFGGDKRRASIGADQTLLMKTLRCYRDAGLEVVVCLGDRESDREIAAELPVENTRFYFCKRSQRGMGASLAEAVDAHLDASAVLIALADMPMVNVQTLHRLCAQATEENIVYPVYEGRRGNPVIFGRRFFSHLIALDGDRGAAGVIASHPAKAVAVRVQDPGVHLDIDTPETLAALREL